MSAPGFEWRRDDFARQLKKSSFAPAARMLDTQSRRDLEAFYAFCRAVDDSADEFSPAVARRHLLNWKRALSRKPHFGSPLLVSAVWELCLRRGIPRRLLLELIQGALSDLAPKRRIASRRELYLYCHRVAGVVGQACLPIFGVPLKRGARYAETLGRAFQLINIIRDYRQDQSMGRCYLAQDDIRGLGSERAVLEAYAELARRELLRSDELALKLPAQGLRPSRLMRALYGGLLEAMIKDGLRVESKRYKLGIIHKAWIVLTSLRS